MKREVKAEVIDDSEVPEKLDESAILVSTRMYTPPSNLPTSYVTSRRVSEKRAKTQSDEGNPNEYVSHLFRK
jgi:hypothetical protein